MGASGYEGGSCAPGRDSSNQVLGCGLDYSWGDRPQTVAEEDGHQAVTTEDACWTVAMAVDEG